MRRDPMRFQTLAELSAEESVLPISSPVKPAVQVETDAFLSAVKDAKKIGGVPILNWDAADEGPVGPASGGANSIQSQGAAKEWLLRFKPGSTEADEKAVCAKLPQGCDFQAHPSLGGVPSVTVHATYEELEAILKDHPPLQYIEVDRQVKLPHEKNGFQASIGSQGAGGSLAQADPDPYKWHLRKIGYESRPRQGQGVHIFIFDTGIRATHVEFPGRVWPALDFQLNNTGALCNGDRSCARDNQGHGTHCAGTAAGERYGVAPKATLYAVKVLTDEGSGSLSWIYAALDWLVTLQKDKRPAVASMSLGAEGKMKSIEEGIDAAVDSGVVVVVAAGNENSDACRFIPAYVKSAITVGSIRETDERSVFSNYGSCVDIWAPGTDIVAAGNHKDDGLKRMSGTSMACPAVAGAAALVLQGTPTLKADGVQKVLIDNAIKGSILGLKSGDDNALLAIGNNLGYDGSPTPAPPAVVLPAAGPVSGSIGFEGAAMPSAGWSLGILVLVSIASSFGMS